MSKEIITSGRLIKKREIANKNEIVTFPPVIIDKCDEDLKPRDKVISKEQILKRIDEMAIDIAANHKIGEKLLIIPVLTGACVFGVHLGQALYEHGLTDVEIDFTRAESYKGQNKSGKFKIAAYPKQKLERRNILLVEDIIDTGETMENVENVFISKGVGSITSAAMVSKPGNRLVTYEADYTGFVCDKIWLEGWGLDTNEEGRLVTHIYKGWERKKPVKQKSFELFASTVRALAQRSGNRITSSQNIFSRRSSGK